MNIKRYKLLHYVLIILLMFAPLRGVMAMQSTHCQMDDMMDNMEASSPNAVMTGSHDMSTMLSTDTVNLNHATHEKPQAVTYQTEKSHQCCCCDNASCPSNCDMGVTVSLVLQKSSYAPAFIDVTKSIIFSSDLLIRELTPPSRPPQRLYS